MAKQQQKRKARPNWFQKQVEKGGQDFLLRKGPLDIQRESLNILRDIARNNIYPKDFPYLFDLKVLSNLKIAAYDKYIELHVIDSAISHIMQTNGVQAVESVYGVAPENLQKVFNNTRPALTAYCTILQNLDTAIAFVQSENTVKNEQSYEAVYRTMMYQLSRFRYII